ncbi:hypothetical protein SPSYN_02646 [Sporotomaculum syntrophicum]|uniref:Uncharacterized protein n=1 Tax=Sporotomaculum syntrophicum TaxID=182264 RepID=A0A9D2WMK5_9FIRM|nr:hypothetical protein [Sporotomaculum syntrophicum]KAF1084242.1 hypothetical protein SPSYN_02646 [Sporotomaculum syntrophicum]
MSKTGNDFPTEMSTSKLAQRIKKDLTWVIVSLIVSILAAAGTYMMIVK